MVWANRNYLNWKANILNELQIFQRKHAQTEPVASILSQSCIYSYAKCNYSNWKTHGLSQLQWFQMKCVLSELIAMISSETQIGGANRLSPHSLSQLQRFKENQAYLSREICTVWVNCNYFIWNKHSPRKLQEFQAKTCRAWGNGHYLSQLQLFQEQRA